MTGESLFQMSPGGMDMTLRTSRRVKGDLGSLPPSVWFELACFGQV
jgi:hypothetical protein